MSENGGARSRSVPIVLALVVIAAIVLRLLWLDRLTGIDGDEAWYGALAQRWAAGDFTLWRTPTGNYPGPIQPALIALGQFVAPSEYILLRIPTLLSSLTAMALAWSIGRRHVDAATGRIALLLMAVLPANIAYARFGWDPSHSGMIVLGGIALALERRLALTMLIFALAVWTHPTNVFAAPLLLIVFIAAERQAGEMPLFTVRNGLLIGAMGLITAIMMATAIQAGQFANAGAIVARLVSPADWLVFVLLFGRLMAGEPWFVHLAGSSYGALLPLVDVVAMTMLAGTAWYAARTLKRDGLTVSGGLLAGWLAMVVAYALIGGNAPLNAPTERYAFVLVAPTALAMAMMLGAALGRPAGTWREAIDMAVAGGALITSTIVFYLVPLATRDGTGDNAFKTGRSDRRRPPHSGSKLKCGRANRCGWWRRIGGYTGRSLIGWRGGR